MGLLKMSIYGVVTAVIGVSFVSSASAAILYQDSFTRSGILNGSTPDVVVTGSQVWQGVGADFGQGSGAYVLNGSSVGQNGAAIDGWAYLALNSASSNTVVLDGSVDFTLSAVVTNNVGQNLGIGLATSQYNGGSMFNGGQAGVYAAVGFSSSNTQSTGPTSTLSFTASGSPGPTAISLNYNAALGNITYVVGGTTRATLSGVSAANIQALNYVAIWSGSFGNNPTAQLDNFTLTTAAVPEPSTYTLLLGGLGVLIGLRRNMKRCPA